MKDILRIKWRQYNSSDFKHLILHNITVTVLGLEKQPSLQILVVSLTRRSDFLLDAVRLHWSSGSVSGMEPAERRDVQIGCREWTLTQIVFIDKKRCLLRNPPTWELLG